MKSELFLFSFLLRFKKWHPDRCTRNPAVAGEAKRQFQLVQEAYSGEIIDSPPLIPVNFVNAVEFPVNVHRLGH